MTNQKQKLFFIIGIVTTLIGLIVLSLGIYSFFNIKKIESTYHSTTAQIEGFEKQKRSNSKNAIKYLPVISYKVNGTEYTQILSSKSHDMETGDTITILYNPDNPEQIRSGEIEKTIYIVSIFAGAITLLSGIFLPSILKFLLITRHNNQA